MPNRSCQVELVETGALVKEPLLFVKPPSTSSPKNRDRQADSIILMSNWYQPFPAENHFKF
jgi:hypothetical protein